MLNISKITRGLRPFSRFLMGSSFEAFERLETTENGLTRSAISSEPYVASPCQLSESKLDTLDTKGDVARVTHILTMYYPKNVVIKKGSLLRIDGDKYATASDPITTYSSHNLVEVVRDEWN